MALPRYYDDPAPMRRIPSDRVWRVWSTLYEAVRRDPMLPLTVAKDLITQAFFYEDDEIGYVPRLSLPIGAILGVVRHAIRTNPKRVRPPVPAKFKRLVNDSYDAPQKITGDKLDFEESTQFLQESEMPDQKGSLKTILQGGIAPFTNMRPANIKLGDSVYSRKADVLRDLTSMHGTASFGFGFRFTSDVSDERKSAIMVFRHNKKGMGYDETANSGNMTVGSDGYHWTNTSGQSYTYDGKVYAPGETVVFSANTVITTTDAAYPQKTWKHAWGYGDTVKVFPTQYSNSDTVNTVVLDSSDATKNVVTPFEHVPSGTPQIYLSALNRADIEDMSCQLNPMMLTRQGEVDWLTSPGTTNQAEGALYDMRYPKGGAQRGISKLRFGQLWLDNQHSHSQFSALYEVNKLDDNPVPRGNNDADYGGTYQGAMGTSFKYNAVIKSGGVQFTCVNRGGSGCNVDVHLFKMKKKHVDSQGYWDDLTWGKIAAPYEDAYMKRAHEIITAENLRGREPQKTDIWTKPKYPLLPGSRLMNSEDTLLNRVSKTSYYIPSQGRKNINIRFPGAKYDPCAVSTVFEGEGANPDYIPDYDEFTYFCLYSVTGEKSSAQYSTKNTSGTLLISLADLFTISSQAAVIPVGATVPVDPSLPDIPLGYDLNTSNANYNKWVLEHQDWGYSLEEYMFYLDQFIDYELKDVTGWTQGIEGPFADGNPNLYPGYYYTRRSRLPLPSLQQWLDANYDTAYVEQGVTWKPPKPKVYRKRHWTGYNEYSSTYSGLLFGGYTRQTAATWVVFDSCEWPVYVSQPAPDPVDPPVDVTPVFDPVEIEVMVRTNFFFLLRLYLSRFAKRSCCWRGASWFSDFII